MATTTVPETQPKTAAPVLTPSAIAKVKEIMARRRRSRRDCACRLSAAVAPAFNIPWPSRMAPA